MIVCAGGPVRWRWSRADGIILLAELKYAQLLESY
jgi:hypothetical protein